MPCTATKGYRIFAAQTNGMRNVYMVSLAMAILVSCTTKPSEQDIRKKLLEEYVCPESAVIRHFEIVQHDEINSDKGERVQRYLVRGQVEWPGGCTDQGFDIPAGRQEGFEQTVFLTEDRNGRWQ